METKTITPQHHQSICSSQIQTQNYDLEDFVEMESMQFVDPHEINPIIQCPRTTSALTQVSSKLDSITEIDSLTQNSIKLKMEEFSDLSALFMGVKSDSTDSTDELITPILDKDAFDFTLGSTNNPNVGNKDVKVKVEFNAQLYPCAKTMYRDFNLGPDKQAQSMENYSISNVGMEQSNMFLYQQFAHDISYKNKKDDASSTFNQHANSFDKKAAFSEASFNSNLSINSNFKYSKSSTTSPQEDRYSFISSPDSDHQMDITVSDLDHPHDAKPKINLMIDKFTFPIKNEGSTIPNTPDVIEEVVNMGTDFNILDLVNNEDIIILNADEELLSPSNPSLSPSTPSIPPKKLSAVSVSKARRRKISYDDDDQDDDYIPPTKRKSTIRLTDIDIEDSNSSNDSDYEDKKPSQKNMTLKSRGRPRKRDSSISSDGSKDTSLSKYRELRDKNNEASRKSRLKRRLKELEFEQEAEQLHGKNIRLKAQVEELEKMVSTFRNNLFKILVNK